MNYDDIFDNLMYFKPYINKSSIQNHLQLMSKYPDFHQVYFKNRQENDNLDTVKNVCMTLTSGLKEEKISENDLDELLFLSIEDKLFNSFLYNLENTNINFRDINSLYKVLESWGTPQENKILNGLASNPTFEKFVISGFRINGTDSIRLLLFDKELVELKEKNKDTEFAVYATLIEFDFRRNLLHIRLRDVDNIQNKSVDVRTMEGRVERTLRFISNLTPSIGYKKISYFRDSLFLLEEHVLQPKRDVAYSKLMDFQDHIDNFSALIDSNFPTQHENNVTTSNYVANTVLAIIASSLDLSQLGDVVGIKFRNQRTEDTNSFAEVAISDKAFKCISTDKLYWSNLSTLLEQRKIEFLKIGTSLDLGFVDVNLELKLGTANVKLNQSSKGNPIEGNKQPSDEKYIDFIDYLLPFIKKND
ncbi:hypothetical protein MKY75_13600 [Paenibacillus sp. FSL L8-0663]|uniref:hypothetical protein n=1 Tax=Paenibacillus sp. FSL L8-0663 TaxID=2921606 RepID=UPI0030FB12C6